VGKWRYVTAEWAERGKLIGFGKRGEATGEWRNLRLRSFVICVSNAKNRWGLNGRDKWKAWERREMHAEIWWGNPKEIYHLQDDAEMGR
jgi:hypothetical protein